MTESRQAYGPWGADLQGKTFYFRPTRWKQLKAQMEGLVSAHYLDPNYKLRHARIKVLTPFLKTHTTPPGGTNGTGKNFSVVEEYMPTSQKLKEVKTNCSWNLPPHLWSLPTVEHMPSLGGLDYKDDKNKSATGRRGKIYHYYTNSSQNNVTVTVDPTSASETQFTREPPTSGDPRKYGFQFIWNPETYATQVGLQSDMTPSPGDAYVAGQGMFPGMSSIQFTIRLDRTNDFACFANGYELGKTTFPSGKLQKYYPQTIQGEYSKWLDKFSNIPKMDWLMTYGTLADIEYLYRAINDINIVGKETKNGFLSADVGYLGFSLLAFELGPVHYIGYVTGISVNHLMFTQKYVPIRSDVTISANVMANGTSSSAYILGNNTIKREVTTTSGETILTTDDGQTIRIAPVE